MDDEAKRKKRERNRKYRETNQEKVKESARRYREANREKIREKNLRYYYANQKKMNEASRRYQRAYPEKKAEAIRRYRERHPEYWVKKTEYDHRYNDANRERIREQHRQWSKANPKKKLLYHIRRRTKKAGGGGSHTEFEWQTLCSLYDHKCLCCGDKPDLLTRDHVVPLSRGGNDDISNIQPLCHHCNTLKGTKTIDYRNKPGIERWIQGKLF